MAIDVSTYYDQTAFDYRFVWGAGRSRAIHFGFYDEQARDHRTALDNLNRALADCAGISPGLHVLDAGCGRGSASLWLAEQRQCTVTGINIVASQLADCQREVQRRPVKNVSFIQADYTRTPFSNASFDVVWACESLCHTERKHAFYHEAFRLLKPGGRLVLAEYLRTARPAQGRGEDLLAAWLHPWAIPDLDTADEHREHALAAGFMDLTLRDVTPNVQVSLRNLHALSQRWLPWGRALHRLGIINQIRLANAQASIRQYEALLAGAWKYGFLLAEKGG